MGKYYSVKLKQGCCKIRLGANMAKNNEFVKEFKIRT